jgi:bifunctional UDP-N-acetylglucosamine pyrophosphorylase / glucosamine-1-phosphate N-acetyltransferase
MNRKCRVVIPAAGSGSRSGLSYPKTLYLLDGSPILVRICRIFSSYDDNPIIIINPASEKMFREVLDKYHISATIVFQHEPKGMGDALLQVKDQVADDDDILLVWSDIPLLSPRTVQQLVDCHTVSKNDFSMATIISGNCYTIVERVGGKLTKVIETRAMGLPPGKDTERDIGLFIFNKQKLFSLLEKDKLVTVVDGKKEHGFLYIIEKLVTSGLKVDGYPVATQQDLFSFNSQADIKEIEEFIQSNAQAQEH